MKRAFHVTARNEPDIVIKSQNNAVFIFYHYSKKSIMKKESRMSKKGKEKVTRTGEIALRSY
jgi:hypothetical protein